MARDLSGVLDAVLAGIVVLDPDGSFSYGPSGDYFGPDTFSYVANDGRQSSTVTLVNIDVTPVNDPPVAVADSYFTPTDTGCLSRIAR